MRDSDLHTFDSLVKNSQRTTLVIIVCTKSPFVSQTTTSSTRNVAGMRAGKYRDTRSFSVCANQKGLAVST